MIGKIEAHDIVHDTLDKLSCDPHLAIPIKYSNRMTRTMGCAYWKGDDYWITLSNILMPYQTYDEQVKTIVHEACHIAAFQQGHRGHGKIWKDCMRWMGYTPDRCHSVSYGYVARCGCKNPLILKKKYAKMLKYGIKYCRMCEQPISLTG